MKKITLLSIVTASVLMAGGDLGNVVDPIVEEDLIQVVEIPTEKKVVVVAPKAPAKVIVKEDSGAKFSGNLNAFYETSDLGGSGNVFDKDSTAFTGAAQLRATKDLGNGFKAGGELTATFGHDDISTFRTALADGSRSTASGALTSAYIGYGVDNTEVQAGRIYLGKKVSPIAFSEKWNAVSNTFEAVTVANADIPNTVIVGAFVNKGNSFDDLSNFEKSNGDKGIYLLSAENKSVPGLGLRGSFYHVPADVFEKDFNVAYANAEYKVGNVLIENQVGYYFGDFVDKETVALGAKVTTDVDEARISGALSHVNDGDLLVRNIFGTRSPLPTQMLVNDLQLMTNNTTGKIGIDTDRFGANFAVDYAYTQDNSDVKSNYQEVDLTYTRQVGDVNMAVAYAYSKSDLMGNGSNTLRATASYQF